jgi:hypothetical protein
MDAKMFIGQAINLDDMQRLAANWLREGRGLGREVSSIEEQLYPDQALMILGGRKSSGLLLCPNNATKKLRGGGWAKDFFVYCEVMRTAPGALKSGIKSVAAPVVYFGAAVGYGIGRLAGRSTGEGKPAYHQMLENAGAAGANIPNVPGKVVENTKRIQCIQIIAVNPAHPPGAQPGLVLPIGEGWSGVNLWRRFEEKGWVKD